MKTCHKCYGYTTDDAKFCPHCGVELIRNRIEKKEKSKIHIRTKKNQYPDKNLVISPNNVSYLIEKSFLPLGSIVDIAWSPNGKFVIFVGSGGAFISDFQSVKIIERESHFFAVAISPDSNYVAYGDCLVTDNNIYKYGLTFNKDYEFSDRIIRIKDLNTNTLTRTLVHKKFTGGNRTSSIKFSPNGLLLATSQQYENVYLWNFSNGELLRRLNPINGNEVSFSPDSKYLASANNSEIVIWRLSDMSKLLELSRRIRINSNEKVHGIDFSPDGAFLASGWSDNVICIWNFPSGKLEKVIEGHSDRVTCVTYSPDGRLLATGSQDETIKIWEATSCSLLRTIEGHPCMINRVIFSPDGKYIASCSNLPYNKERNKENSTVRIWGIGEY
jgi:WD40 repeat protein